MTIPKIFTPQAHLWLGLSRVMGEVVLKILLTIVFILIVTPIGLIRKGLGKDPMRLKRWKKGADSVFIDRSHTFVPEDIEKPF
jgi:hypothetical protein